MLARDIVESPARAVFGKARSSKPIAQKPLGLIIKSTDTLRGEYDKGVRLCMRVRGGGRRGKLHYIPDFCNFFPKCLTPAIFAATVKLKWLCPTQSLV